MSLIIFSIELIILTLSEQTLYQFNNLSIHYTFPFTLDSELFNVKFKM